MSGRLGVPIQLEAEAFGGRRTAAPLQVAAPFFGLQKMQLSSLSFAVRRAVAWQLVTLDISVSKIILRTKPYLLTKKVVAKTI